MTLASTTAAIATLPRNPLWGIGRYTIDGRHIDFPISWDDWARDTAWIKLLLVEHGLVPRSGVVVVSGMPESPWFDPVETAIRELGSPFSIGEVLPFEAFRTGLYARRLPVEMILGMNAAVAEGLGDELGEVVAGIHTVFTRPSAKPMVEAAGGRPFQVTRVGPALAVECPQRNGAHINADEWHVNDAGGRLRVSTVGPRAFQLNDSDTGIAGSVDRAGCACGRSDPRIDVDPTHPV